MTDNATMPDVIYAVAHRHPKSDDINIIAAYETEVRGSVKYIRANTPTNADHWYKRIYDCISLTPREETVISGMTCTMDGGFKVDAPRLMQIIGEIQKGGVDLAEVRDGLKPEHWPENYWVTNQKIDEVWGNANFGTRPKREVIREALAQTAADYSTGHTSLCICRYLGLICGAVGKPKLTVLGRKYLYYANKYRILQILDAQPSPAPVATDGMDKVRHDTINEILAICPKYAFTEKLQKEIRGLLKC